MTRTIVGLLTISRPTATTSVRSPAEETNESLSNTSGTRCSPPANIHQEPGPRQRPWSTSTLYVRQLNGTLNLNALRSAQGGFKGASEIELQEMRQFLENFVLIPVDKAVAERIAAVRRENKIEFPDAAIIATALFTMSSLVTRDKRLHTMRNLTVISI